MILCCLSHQYNLHKWCMISYPVGVSFYPFFWTITRARILSWGGFGRLCGSLSKPLVLAYVISTIILRWLGCSLLIRMLQIKINSTISVVFVWFDLIILLLINNLSVIKGRGFLGWTSTKLGLMYLLNDTTQLRRWWSNPRPLGLESSTLPLSHSAPKQYQ